MQGEGNGVQAHPEPATSQLEPQLHSTSSPQELWSCRSWTDFLEDPQTHSCAAAPAESACMRRINKRHLYALVFWRKPLSEELRTFLSEWWSNKNKTKPRCHYYVIHQRKKISCCFSILYYCKYHLFTYLGFWTVDQTTQSVLIPHCLLVSWNMMMSIWHNFQIVYCSPKMYRIWSYYRLHATRRWSMWKSFCEPVFQLQKIKKGNIKSWPENHTVTLD